MFSDILRSGKYTVRSVEVGGLSKGERNRIKLRVRAAMAAQAAIEGRFLGGRPPYGYRIADAGPHPNPAKAADGKRLHKLEPDPQTAWVIRRIFAEYLAGRGLFAIAEALTRDQVPSPSQHDAARNPHRTGQGWAKSAIRAIVRNPRYTGRQVWNKQRKDEVLLDVNDVARGYETRLRWNDTAHWVWSETLAQEPLVSVEDFEAARAIMAGAGRGRQASHETRERVRNPYALRGRLYCGSCGRKMQGQYSNHDPYYRCRYPKEYALASHVRHPGNVYLREADILPAIDTWLAVIFAPHRLTQTIAELQAAQAAPATPEPAPDEDTRATIAGCDARYAERMMVENELDAYIGGFHLDALTGGVPLNVDLDTTLTVVAGNLYRLFALKLPRYETATPDRIWQHFLDATGTLHITEDAVTCALNLRSHHPVLIDAGFADLEIPIPWWDGRTLRFRFPPR